MKWTVVVIAALLLSSGFLVAGEVVTFSSYVDSDLCSHLMLGPITPARVQCSQKTYKEGSNAVLVRLKDSLIIQVNKDKLINKMVGQLAKASGELNLNDSSMKLSSVEPIEGKSLPATDPGRVYLDVRNTPATAGLEEKIRHTLAMMPYLSYYDFISFNMAGNNVLLNGWTIRPLNRSEAFNRTKDVEGVGTIINNIEVLPVSMMDRQNGAAAVAALQQNLSQYFWGSGSDIKVIAKNGDVILLGTVNNSGDFDLANIRVNSVPNIFHVFNMLRVTNPDAVKKKTDEADKEKKKHGW
jgi:osmotically-inducible protein OsmY